MLILKAHIYGRTKTIDILKINNCVKGMLHKKVLAFLCGDCPGCFFQMVTGETRSLFSSWMSSWNYCVYLLIWHDISSGNWYGKWNRVHQFIFLYNHYLLLVKIKLKQRYKILVFSFSITVYHFQFNAYKISLVYLLLSLILKIHFPQDFFKCPTGIFFFLTGFFKCLL